MRRFCSKGNLFKFLTIAGAMVMAISAANGQGKVLDRVVEHNGKQRSYLLYVPSGYSSDRPCPLVLTFHGMFGNAKQMMLTTKMNAVAEKENFLAAYPNAIGGNWMPGNDPAESLMDSLKYVDSTIESINSDYAVEGSRVFATGFSMGGVMSYFLGVTRPDKFAAIASVSGTRPGIDSTRLFPFSVDVVPKRPMPLLHIHGTSDIVNPYTGGALKFPGMEQEVPFPAVLDVVNDWAKANGSEDIGHAKLLDDICLKDGAGDSSSTVSLFEFQGCKGYHGKSGKEIVAEVVFYRVNRGGHSWPVLEKDRESSIAALTETYGEERVKFCGAVNSDISASEEIWKFFKRHELPSTR